MFGHYLLRACLALLIAGVATAAAAQSYPTRPIKMLIPFPPGGSNDVAGRILAAALTNELHEQVFVENRSGAGGVIGTEVASKAAPDGYTVLVISSAYPVSGALYKLNYDPEKAFTPVARFGSGAGVLTVNPKVPVHSVKELIAYANTHPGQFNFASAGIGSFEHLAEALFMLKSQAKITIVQYKGGGPALTDLLGDHVQAQIGSLIQTTPHIEAGELRALGVSGAHRVPALPNVPTIAEAGVQGYDATNWWGIVVPAGTPQPIVEKLHDAVNAVAGTPDMKTKLEKLGAEPAPMSIAEFKDFIAQQTTLWTNVVKEAHIHVE